MLPKRTRLILTFLAGFSLLLGMATIAIFILQRNREDRSAISSVPELIIQEQLKEASLGYQSPDNSFVVQIEDEGLGPDPYTWNSAPTVEIWKYEDNKLRPSGDLDFQKAENKGDIFIFMFVVRSIEWGRALVDVAIFYPNTTTAIFSSGGKATHLQLKFVDSEWVIESKEDYFYWD